MPGGNSERRGQIGEIRRDAPKSRRSTQGHALPVVRHKSREPDLDARIVPRRIRNHHRFCRSRKYPFLSASNFAGKGVSLTE